MIYTLTLNPALDYDVYLDNFSEGDLNLSKEINIRAGGKGINVSKVLANLDLSSKALGFTGGFIGDFIKKDLEIIRDKLELPTVKLEIKKQGTEDIAYLKIYQFTSHTLEKVIDSTAQIKKNGTKKIIIDLRNNPGGLLDQTILISGLFLDKEKITDNFQH